MGKESYRKAKEIVAAAEAEPEKYGKLAETMDRTGRVAGVHKQLKTMQAAEDIASEPPPLPTGPFRVLVVDPPWEYEQSSSDPSHRSTCPYPGMTVSEVERLPVESLAADDCVLWLWTTNAYMREAHEIADGWGFRVKTILTWVKDRIGCGNWLRGQTEHCLLCVKGKPTVTLTNQSTVLNAARRDHSRKPEEFYALVDTLCPGSKCELFARHPREGWTQWGNEMEGS
jgi:N6-adenosine-specific RNA methylase IME4